VETAERSHLGLHPPPVPVSQATCHLPLVALHLEPVAVSCHLEPVAVSCHLEPVAVSCHLEPVAVSCHLEPVS